MPTVSAAEDMLRAVLALIPLDTYAEQNFILMQTVPGDARPEIWDSYKNIADSCDKNVRLGMEERFAFYERAKKAYAIPLQPAKKRFTLILF